MEKIKENFKSSTTQTKVNFEWSMKPITVLMTTFGHQMGTNNNTKNSRLRTITIFIIGLTILLVNIFINAVSFMKIFNVYQYKTVPIYMSYLIGHLFDDLMVIGIPLSLMAIQILTHRWTNMLMILETIQSEMNLSLEVHQRIRRFAFFSVLFFVIVSIKKLFLPIVIVLIWFIFRMRLFGCIEVLFLFTGMRLTDKLT